ncbi:unnamed protein product [Rhizoctonia solani]|nr:unnamed protein product [Rhizoctonia solani]
MGDTLLSLSGDACAPATLCSTPNSNANSDVDLETATDKNAAWAGIAVVIVVVAVGAGVWFAIRQRRRARGGHNSVETGAAHFTWFKALWRPKQAASESQAEQGQQRPSTHLKRTSTSQLDVPPVAKLDPQLKENYPMVPLHHPQLQSTETFTSTHTPSPNPRDSLVSSHRSSGSLSRINMPPPGLGPPMHRPESPSTPRPPAQN